MAVFSVQGVIRLEIGFTVENVRAKDEDGATEKVQALIDKGKIDVRWSDIEGLPDSVTTDESNRETEIESVDIQS